MCNHVNFHENKKRSISLWFKIEDSEEKANLHFVTKAQIIFFSDLLFSIVMCKKNLTNKQ